MEAVTGELLPGKLLPGSPVPPGGRASGPSRPPGEPHGAPSPRSPPVSGQRRRPAPCSPLTAAAPSAAAARPPRAAPEQGRRGCSSPLVLRPLRPRPGRPAPAASAERARPRYRRHQHRRLGSARPSPPPRYVRRAAGSPGGGSAPGLGPGGSSAALTGSPPAVRGPGERRQPASGTLRGRDPAPTRRSLTSRVVQKSKELDPFPPLLLTSRF